MIGDIFAKPGRKTVAKILPKLRKEKKIDFVVANAENIHHGKGASDAKIKELINCGVDFFTSGNHIWKIRDIYEFLDDPNYPLIRPANYPEGAHGRGYSVVDIPGTDLNVSIINLMGRVYMPFNLDDPFRKADQILQEIASRKYVLGQNLAAILVDFHAEAASEKIALGHYLDGRITAICGTHTHIQTADELILPGKTAYLSDLGMTGVIDSVIGVRKDIIIEGFLKQTPVRHEMAEGETVFGALLIDTDKKTGLAKKIERIQIRPISV